MLKLRLTVHAGSGAIAIPNEASAGDKRRSRTDATVGQCATDRGLERHAAVAKRGKEWTAAVGD